MAKKIKIKAKDIVAIVLAILTFLGVVAGIVALSNPPEKKQVSLTVFSVGGLNVNGEYIETKESIYTKDLIECQGLEIEPDFESNVEYQVFYYDYEKSFIRSTDLMIEPYKKDEDTAVYCRIVIFPIPEEDEEIKIYFWEVIGIANDLKIMVNRKQDVSGITVSGPVFETIATDYIPTSTDQLSQWSSAPYMYKDTTLFCSSRVYKIGVPVGTIVDPTLDNVFTVYVVEKNGEWYFPVSEHTLTIKANTYETTDVYEWVYFDCDIKVGINQTLAFLNANGTDTIVFAVKYQNLNAKYLNVNHIFSSSIREPNLDIYFDVHIERSIAEVK